jgi:hypothetical protein
MQKRIVFVAVVLCGGLTACVQSTTTMLDSRTAIISGRGSAFDDNPQVVKAMLSEAAETTKARGFTHFQIVGSQDATRHGAVVLPGQTTTTGTMSGTANTFGNFGTYGGTYTSRTTTTPGTVIPTVMPGADITIRMYAEGEVSPNTPGLWSAESILAETASG